MGAVAVAANGGAVGSAGCRCLVVIADPVATIDRTIVGTALVGFAMGALIVPADGVAVVGTGSCGLVATTDVITTASILIAIAIAVTVTVTVDITVDITVCITVCITVDITVCITVAPGRAKTLGIEETGALKQS